jgi:cold shock CspA family protein
MERLVESTEEFRQALRKYGTVTNFSLHTPRPAASCPMIASAPHSGSLVTMLCIVKWFDSAKGFGFAVPIEPGHPDVFLDDEQLRASGVADPEPRTFLKLTFDPSRYTAHRRPKALAVQLP